MMDAARFRPDRLVEQACELTGYDDFGADGWQEGLGRLTDGLVRQAKLSDLGVEIAIADILRAMVNRLNVIGHRRTHPAVAEEAITHPVVIIGQPRTGTTILYDLLAQDPELRAPLTWEVDEPCPVPDPATYDTDPRIAKVQATIEMSESIIPGFLAFHHLGAQVGQECVRIFASEFTSMIFSVQYRLPDYYRWLMYDADHASALRFHRIFLQHLQSGVRGQWLLKSPAHLWQLDTLLAEYPDAQLVQTHRDPLSVIASVSALTNLLRRLASDKTDVAECARQSYEEIAVGVERSMSQRDDGTVPPGQIIDVNYAAFVADPFTAIRTIYDGLGRELKPATEKLMRNYLAQHPGDGGAGRYTWADTGLDAGEVRERFRGYQNRFNVPDDKLK